MSMMRFLRALRSRGLFFPLFPPVLINKMWDRSCASNCSQVRVVNRRPPSFFFSPSPSYARKMNAKRGWKTPNSPLSSFFTFHWWTQRTVKMRSCRCPDQ